jgi:hypothetical protein
MKTLTLRLTNTLDAELGAAARRCRTTKAALARRALEKLVNGKRPPRGGSAADLMGELLGSLQGPGDLSVNKAYLEDLGRS